MPASRAAPRSPAETGSARRVAARRRRKGDRRGESAGHIERALTCKVSALLRCVWDYASPHLCGEVFAVGAMADRAR